MYTTLAALLLVATSSLALAAPGDALLTRQADGSSGYITLIAVHSASPIHLAAIEASNSSFFIHRPTASYCPLEGSGNCPVGNVTALEVGNGGASMDVAVPGGQQVYVLPSGALSFAPAHSEGTPIIENGTTAGFTYVNATGTEDLGHFKFQGGDFLACPVGVPAEEAYQVFAAISTLSDANVPGGKLSACLGMDALGYPYTKGLAAWQYE